MLLQIQHAGDGGLYAELISDRSFGGLAYSLGLPHSEASTRIVPATYLESQYLTFSPTAELSTSDLNLTGIRRWRAAAAPEYR